jgi:FMN-dependent NADH-azoreductase
MPTILRVDSSFRTEGSVSRALADSAQTAWRAHHGDGVVTRRDLGAKPLPAEAWGLAVGANFTPEADRTVEQLEALALVRTLGDEILEADTVLVAAPLYNFGVPQFLKTWIDLLISDPRLGPGSAALTGKPAVLLIARGGGYGEGTPRHGWDHATPYLERIFRDNFGMDLTTIAAELTLAGVNPALADFIGIAEQSLATAHVEAAAHGRRLAERLQTAA